MKKTNKLDEITHQPTTGTKSVFASGAFNNLPGGTLAPMTEEVSYTKVSLENILLDHYVDYPSFLLESISNSMLINPVILIQDYEEREKAGRKFRQKTGKYRVLDGKRRISIFHNLFEKAQEENNTKEMRKYSVISAAVLPLNVDDDIINEIKKMTEENRGNLVANILDDVTKTKDITITHCYKYEMAEVEFEKIIDRDNAYRITQSEVDELEQSIYLAGLMQPIIVLPIIESRTMEVRYQIQAGHKRKRAIAQLVQHAKEGMYKNADEIIDKYEYLNCVVIPMGATKEQVEKIYNDTNLLSRHMTADDLFTHIDYFDELPSRPKTKTEYQDFKEARRTINSLANIMLRKIEKIGFRDWKLRNVTKYLNVYYYGSDRSLELYLSDNSPLTKHELEKIVNHYKDFDDRIKQDELIEAAILDKSALDILTPRKKKAVPKRNAKDVREYLLKAKNDIDKIQTLEVTTKEEVKDLNDTIKILEDSLSELKKKINNKDNIKG